MSTNPIDPLVIAIADAVVQRLGAALTGPRLLTIEGAALYLSMSEDAIRHKVVNGKIPSVRIDRLLRFDVRDLEKWLEANKG
jgi:excisionase family DNA binding protein